MKLSNCDEKDTNHQMRERRVMNLLLRGVTGFERGFQVGSVNKKFDFSLLGIFIPLPYEMSAESGS